MLITDSLIFEPARKRVSRRWPRSPSSPPNRSSTRSPTASTPKAFSSSSISRARAASELPPEAFRVGCAVGTQHRLAQCEEDLVLDDLAPSPRQHFAAYMHLHREGVAMTAASHGGSRKSEAPPLTELRRGSAQTLRLDVDGLDLGGERVEGSSVASSSGYVALESAAWTLPAPKYEDASASITECGDRSPNDLSQSPPAGRQWRHMFDCEERHDSEDTFAAHLRHDCVHAHPIHNAETILDAQTRERLLENGQHADGLGIDAGPGAGLVPSISQRAWQSSPADHEQVLGGFASLGLPMGVARSVTSTKGSSMQGASSASSTPALEAQAFTSSALRCATLTPSRYDASETLDLLTIEEMGQHSINIGSASDWIGTRMSSSATQSKGWSVARATTRARKWIVAPLGTDDDASQQLRASRAFVVSDHVPGSRAENFVGSQSSGSAFQATPTAPPIFELRPLRPMGSPFATLSEHTTILASPLVYRSLLTDRGLSAEQTRKPLTSSTLAERRLASIRHDPLPLVEARRPSLGKSFSTEALPLGATSHAATPTPQIEGAASPTRHSTPASAFAPVDSLDHHSSEGYPPSKDMTARFSNYKFGVAQPSAGAASITRTDTLMPPNFDDLHDYSPRTSLTYSSAEARNALIQPPVSTPMNVHASERKSRGADKRLADWFRKRRVPGSGSSPAGYSGAPSVNEMDAESLSVTKDSGLLSASISSDSGTPLDATRMSSEAPRIPTRSSARSMAAPPSKRNEPIQQNFDFLGSNDKSARDLKKHHVYMRGEPLRKALTTQQLDNDSGYAAMTGVQAGRDSLHRVRSTSEDVALGNLSVKAPLRGSPLNASSSKATTLTTEGAGTADTMGPSHSRHKTLRRPRSIASGMISRTAKSTPTSEDFSLLAEVLAQESASSRSPTSEAQYSSNDPFVSGDNGFVASSWALNNALLGTDADASQAASLIMIIPLFSAMDAEKQIARPRRYLRIAYVSFDANMLGASPVNAFSSSQREPRGASTPPLQLPAASLGSDSHHPAWYRKLASALGHHASEHVSMSEKDSASTAEWSSPEKAKPATLQPRRRSPTVGPFRVTALVLPGSDDAFGKEPVPDLPEPFTFPLVLALCDARRSVEFVPEGWAALGLTEGPIPGGCEGCADELVGTNEGRHEQPEALQRIADLVIAGCSAIMDL
ncbi:hypothetical protein CBOM_01461 [Ceraceosorus bombacis]|uniref:Uncharacterized protein n=1 Tax=Ceraceosorus bombacis TaxID=401625 RepID=A0A0P1BBW5_9BASI|nr:hypothetical protein CBOM_01461 [Ceraceosorus bombacis]